MSILSAPHFHNETAAIGTIFEPSHVKYIIALICRNTGGREACDHAIRRTCLYRKLDSRDREHGRRLNTG
jgi:hypothetical protein